MDNITEHYIAKHQTSIQRRKRGKFNPCLKTVTKWDRDKQLKLNPIWPHQSTFTEITTTRAIHGSVIVRKIIS